MTLRYALMAEREVEAAAEIACDWNTDKLCLIPIPASLEKSDFSLLHAPNCQPVGFRHRLVDARHLAGIQLLTQPTVLA